MLLIRFLGLTLSLLGGYGALVISLANYHEHSSCPSVFSIPACYLILICYLILSSLWLASLIASSTLLLKYRSRLFWFALTPVLILAIMGSIGELFGIVSCPKTSNGIAKCFLSLGLILTIGICWLLSKPRKSQ